MGCVGSKPAAVDARDQGDGDRPPKQQDADPTTTTTKVASKLDAADGADVQGIAAAAFAGGAVTMTAASSVAAGVVNANPEELLKVTGQALLEVAKTLPLVAPVAYLIGAIASSAVTAVSLKSDCLEFGKVVRMLENVLLKAESLESQTDVIDDVRTSLEEALVHMQQMQDRGVLSATFLARSDKNRFEELKTKIEQAIQRLTLASSVDTAVITQAQFKQSEELRIKVEELGGPEAVAKDPDAQKEIEAAMTASDAVVNANVRAARRDIKSVGTDIMTELNVIKRMQTEDMQKAEKERRKSISMQHQTSNKLEEMTTNFIQIQQQNELQRLQNDLLKRQVNELKGMLSDVKDCMQKFPMPPKEPDRMLVMNTGGFMQLDQRDTSFQVLQDIARECTLKWRVAAFFNFIGDLKQYTAVGYLPEHPDDADRPVEMALDLCALEVPRKITMCQFVVNEEKPIVMDGIKDHPAPAAQEDLMAASKTDPVLADFLGKLQNDVNVFQNTPNDEKTKEIAEDFLKRCTHNPEGYFYAGAPLVVDGQTCGTLCLIGAHKPKNFEGMDELLAHAKKASSALEKQHHSKKVMNGQMAMMQQMQMQQMQMMQQMMAQQQQAAMGGMPAMGGVGGMGMGMGMGMPGMQQQGGVGIAPMAGMPGMLPMGMGMMPPMGMPPMGMSPMNMGMQMPPMGMNAQAQAQAQAAPTATVGDGARDAEAANRI